MDSNREVILVTGSSGLIGSAFVEHVAADYRLVGLDRYTPPHPPPKAECVCVDLTSDETVKAGFERLHYAYGEQITSVVHLAAFYDFSGKPSPLYESITVRGTERLLRALKSFRVGQFVFSSTMLVHAPTVPGQPINEEWPLKPTWPYPRSKVETETLIRRERGEIPVVLLRIAGVYDDLGHSIPLAHQMQRIYERLITSKLYPGDTSRGQAFVHLVDLVEALRLTVERRQELPPVTTILLGEPETLGYETLQQTFGRLIHGEEWQTRRIPKPLAKAGAWLEDALPFHESFVKPWMVDLADDHFELDITRARKVLGWEPRRSLRETLPAMAQALKDDAAMFYRENKLGEAPKRAPARAHRPRDSARPYTCPMHPEIQQTIPGQCPKCGMELEPRSDGDEPTPENHREMLIEMRRSWLWTNFTVISLGLWLVTSPFTFGYESRSMLWSDAVSGTLLIVLSALALLPRFDFVGRWGVSLVGVWLQFAPLLFWAPTAAAYLNDTLVGVLAITLSILVPMMPGMAHHMEMMKPGPEIPPGWSYNPSSWHQRALMIALALIGALASRYLAAFQLGHIDSVWEPFFGEGTLRVLTSDVSKAFPISDAGLGAAAYTFEMLMGWMGGRERWRTMPWMVTFFFILVVPLGVTSIVLVMLQPIAVGYWCTICLFTAFVMLLMIPLAVDEVIAMGQFLRASVRGGKSFWRTFWVGGALDEVSADTRTPRYGAPVSKLIAPMVWGVTVPPTLILSAALGLWLMAAPSIFGSAGLSADSDHLVGALIVTVSVTVMAEVVRAGRFLNVLLGAWLIASPWWLGAGTPGAMWNGIATGVLLIAFSIPRGSVRERYAAWDRFIV